MCVFVLFYLFVFLFIRLHMHFHVAYRTLKPRAPPPAAQCTLSPALPAPLSCSAEQRRCSGSGMGFCLARRPSGKRGGGEGGEGKRARGWGLRGAAAGDPGKVSAGMQEGKGRRGRGRRDARFFRAFRRLIRAYLGIWLCFVYFLFLFLASLFFLILFLMLRQ